LRSLEDIAGKKDMEDEVRKMGQRMRNDRKDKDGERI
jgi:hypothetical protein